MGLLRYLSKCCSGTCKAFLSEGQRRWLKGCFAFVGGFVLGHIYYNCMLKGIPFIDNIGNVFSIILSLVIGLLNVIATQIRCISLLTFPMYCGKPGRGVLKAVVLTYVVAGPITNMGRNAREVVRVFACSTELAYNLSRAGSAMVARPVRRAVAGLKDEIEGAAETLRFFKNVTAPLISEIEYGGEVQYSRELTDQVDTLLGEARRSTRIESKYAYALPFAALRSRALNFNPDTKLHTFSASPSDQPKDVYQKKYQMKTEYRCNNLLSRTVLHCGGEMKSLHRTCMNEVPAYIAHTFCSRLNKPSTCNVFHVVGSEICDSRKQKDPGLGEGYVALKRARRELMKGPTDILVKNKDVHDIYDAQDAKETGERVKQAFEEKFSIMQSTITVVNICMALLFLRIVVAARCYHDMYLTNIDYDNIYVTKYFKRIDERRRLRNQCTLLPMKKMERSRYVDVYSLAYTSSDRHRLLAQALKVLLEVVTATTFVMLDRLFYEALDVVRQHAERSGLQGTKGLEIEVEGIGIIANTLRAMLSHLDSQARRSHREASNVCLPCPSPMPTAFFVRIYGGYLWILLLLCANPYTMRLRRVIASYFYPRREKQRILHLYNDILKKRIKLDETLRRKAVQAECSARQQAVRAHYLSGEGLLSARMRFPSALGWLRVLPAARMTCLICGEIEPRGPGRYSWHACSSARCPFVSCPECWREAGARCLACDPSLTELSDIDSLSDDELPRY